MWVIRWWFERIACKKLAICWKTSYFSYVFDSFSLYLCPIANCSHRSLLIRSFLKSDLSNSLPSLFTKEQPWAICSGRSWQKSNRSNLLFFTSESLFCSFAHKKRAICSKTRWMKSQPCIFRPWNASYLKLWIFVRYKTCFWFDIICSVPDIDTRPLEWSDFCRK